MGGEPADRLLRKLNGLRFPIKQGGATVEDARLPANPRYGPHRAGKNADAMANKPIGFHRRQEAPDDSRPSYTLKEVSPGQYAYRFMGEPEHYACPRCWDADNKRVVMQVGPPDTYDDGDLICGACRYVVLGVKSNPKR